MPDCSRKEHKKLLVHHLWLTELFRSAGKMMLINGTIHQNRELARWMKRMEDRMERQTEMIQALQEAGGDNHVPSC